MNNSSPSAAVRRFVCKTCGAEFDGAPTGRPPGYCKRSCKDRAGYERRRDKILAYQVQYRAENPDKVRAYSREYRNARRDEMRAYNRTYYASKRDRWYEYNRQYRIANPEKFALYSKTSYNQRRARMMGAGSPGVSPADWRRLVVRFDGRCAYCGQRSERLTMDHVIPLSRGGRHGIGNVLPACMPCNQSKGSKYLVEWRRETNGRAVCGVVHRDVLSAV